MGTSQSLCLHAYPCQLVERLRRATQERVDEGMVTVTPTSLSFLSQTGETQRLNWSMLRALIREEGSRSPTMGITWAEKWRNAKCKTEIRFPLGLDLENCLRASASMLKQYRASLNPPPRPEVLPLDKAANLGRTSGPAAGHTTGILPCEVYRGEVEGQEASLPGFPCQRGYVELSHGRVLEISTFAAKSRCMVPLEVFPRILIIDTT